MNKPIKLCIEEATAIEAALRAVNGRASTHAWTLLSEIERVANRAERELENLGIPKKDRAGAIFAAASGGELAKAYKYKASGTRVEITRRTSGWYLTDASPIIIFPGARGTTSWLRLTEKQDAKAIEVLRRNYAIIRPLAAAQPAATPAAEPATTEPATGRFAAIVQSLGKVA